jgi:hypothetical protein
MYSNDKYIFFSNRKIFGITKYMIYKLKKNRLNYKFVYRKLFRIIMFNEKFKIKLKNTGNKLIAFCVENNCGVGYDEIDVYKKYLDEWTCENLVGQILMEIRFHIK